MSTKFIKNIEDFVCQNCGSKVVGNGYTNHCPKCLWSKHVDNNPGDRMADCGGMMKPIRVENISGGQTIHHLCLKCGRQRKNKVSKSDNFDQIIFVAGQGDTF